VLFFSPLLWYRQCGNTLLAYAGVCIVQD